METFAAANGGASGGKRARSKGSAGVNEWERRGAQARLWMSKGARHVAAMVGARSVHGGREVK
jgi:hypothetical protein